MRGEKECSDEYYDFDEEVKNFHPLDREILVSAMKEAVNQKITASIIMNGFGAYIKVE